MSWKTEKTEQAEQNLKMSPGKIKFNFPVLLETLVHNKMNLTAKKVDFAFKASISVSRTCIKFLHIYLFFSTICIYSQQYKK